MTLLRRQVTRWLLALGLAGSVSLADVGQANAQFFDFLGQVFGSPARRSTRAREHRRARHAPPGYVRIWVPPRSARGDAGVRAPERVRRADVRAPRHSRFRLASLSDPAGVPKRHSAVPFAGRAVRPGAGIKPGGRPPIADPVAALMNDPTLRRGDIVVLPGGPGSSRAGGPRRTGPPTSRMSAGPGWSGTGCAASSPRCPCRLRSGASETETAARAPEKPEGAAAKETPLDVTVTGTVPRHDQP